MDYILILARSVTYAQRMQRALQTAGIRCGISRAPRDMTDLGCAYVLRLAASDLPQALSVIHRAGLDPVSIYSYRNGVYREVSHDLF